MRPVAPLRRVLAQMAAGKGTMKRHDRNDWSSSTFAGTSHEICWEFRDHEVEAGEQMIARLDQSDFDLPGELVVSAEVHHVCHDLQARVLVLRARIVTVEKA